MFENANIELDEPATTLRTALPRLKGQFQLMMSD